MESKVRRGIGLVAHDAMKKDLIEWVLWNSELLMGNKFYCTGTTGTLILEALKEKHPDEEWDFTILKSGPLGGDQQKTIFSTPAKRVNAFTSVSCGCSVMGSVKKKR